MTTAITPDRLHQIQDLVREASRDHGPMLVSQESWLRIVNELMDEREQLLTP